MRASRQAGFTILELMVTITVLGILVAFAVPTFRELILNNRRTVVVNELMSSLLLARSEAAKRGQAVSLCALTAGGGTSCTGGTDWSYGWMTFVDADGNGAIASASDVIRKFRNDSSSAGLRVTSSTGGPGHFVLRPFNQSGTTGNLKVCDPRGASKARIICVQGNGRARLSETACDGTAITCP